MAKKPLKRKALPVPQTREEAVRLLGEIGEIKQELLVLTLTLNDRIEALKTEAERRAEPAEEKLEQKLDALHAYCEANRNELLPGQTKTAVFSTGTVSWRTTPPSVNISNTKDVLKRIKRLKLFKFVRTVEEINKEAMLIDKAAANSIQGVSITQKEEFIVKPSRISLEIVRRTVLKRDPAPKISPKP